MKLSGACGDRGFYFNFLIILLFQFSKFPKNESKNDKFNSKRALAMTFEVKIL